MFFRSIVSAAALLAILSTTTAASTLPTLRAEDLNGTKLVLPTELPSDLTLVLIGFQHKDQKNIDDWISRLDLRTGQIPWIEISAIGPVPSLVKGMIRTAMQSRLRTPAERSHMIPFFGDRTELLAKLDTKAEDMSVLVVNRAGQVLSQESGPFDATKAASVMGALKQSTKTIASDTSKVPGQ